MDKPIDNDPRTLRQRVTAVQGAEVLLGHRRATRDGKQRKAAAQFAQRFEHSAHDREQQGANAASTRWATASLSALFRDEALQPTRDQGSESQAVARQGEEPGRGNEDRRHAHDDVVEQRTEPKTLSNEPTAVGASSAHVLEQAALSLQETFSGPSIEQLAREIAHCVRHSARIRAGQWQMTLRLKHEILPETELAMKGNGYRLSVLLRTADADVYRLVSEKKEELDALLRKRGATDVVTAVAFEPLSEEAKPPG